eukprot:355925-Chlamydomonas_euryale.AAC.3
MAAMHGHAGSCARLGGGGGGRRRAAWLPRHAADPHAWLVASPCRRTCQVTRTAPPTNSSRSYLSFWLPPALIRSCMFICQAAMQAYACSRPPPPCATSCSVLIEALNPPRRDRRRGTGASASRTPPQPLPPPVSQPTIRVRGGGGGGKRLRQKAAAKAARRSLKPPREPETATRRRLTLSVIPRRGPLRPAAPRRPPPGRALCGASASAAKDRTVAGRLSAAVLRLRLLGSVCRLRRRWRGLLWGLLGRLRRRRRRRRGVLHVFVAHCDRAVRRGAMRYAQRGAWGCERGRGRMGGWHGRRVCRQRMSPSASVGWTNSDGKLKNNQPRSPTSVLIVCTAWVGAGAQGSARRRRVPARTHSGRQDSFVVANAPASSI